MEANQQQKDEQLWKIAEKRARFKKHLTTYLIMNSFFWVLWFFSEKEYHGGVPWPVWPMLGWGIGVAFQYFDAFHNDKLTNTQKEYEKLKREKEGM